MNRLIKKEPKHLARAPWYQLLSYVLVEVCFEGIVDSV